MADQFRSIRIASNGIHVQWGDGHQGCYPHWYLRAACRCADCRDSSSRNRTEFYENIPEYVQALDWISVGQYAVQFLWSDEHSTGFYALETLRELCRCPACVAKAIGTMGTRGE